MDISFRSVRIESKSLEVPLFMDNAQNDAINEIIDNFENSIGLKEEDFDSNFIFDTFSDSKIAKGVNFILTKYFYDHKGLDSADLKAPERRIKLFELMEESGLSWAPPRQQKQLLMMLSEKNNLAIQDLEKNLFADFSENFKVIRRTEDKPTVDMVIRHYNTEIIKFLLAKSYSLSFNLVDFSTKGYFVKNVIKSCKLLGIEYDLEVFNDSTKGEILKVSLTGPNELVGRNIKYSNNLFAFFIRNLILQNEEVGELYLEVQYFETKKQVYLPLKGFPTIVDDSQEEVLYDSNIEKVFNEQWSINFPHWLITREPLIIEKNLVMVPDFLLTYGSKSFYLEIVGFWTERYLTKKIKKVTILSSKFPDKYQNMILLVDKNLDWPKAQVPTFFYGKKVPVVEIGSFLKPFEDIEIEQTLKSKNFEYILATIKKELKNKSNIYEQELFDIFSVNFSFELIKHMDFLYNNFSKEISFVYFSNENFISSVDFLKEIQRVVSLARINYKLDFQSLTKQYSFLNEKILKILLTYLGYDFKYKSLLEEALIFKKDRFIKAEIV